MQKKKVKSEYRILTIDYWKRHRYFLFYVKLLINLTSFTIFIDASVIIENVL